MQTAHLILNGTIEPDWLAKQLYSKEHVFCTDGAYAKAAAIGLAVEAVIGDFDSARWEGVTVRKIHIPDQNHTDFEKALHLLSKRFQKVHVYGADGGEMDHVLGNLSAAKGFRKKIRIIFLNPHQKYFFAPKRLRINGAKGNIVSIMPFPIAEGVTLRGFKYPLKEATLRLGGRIGIRNLAVKDVARVSFEKGCLIVFLSN